MKKDRVPAAVVDAAAAVDDVAAYSSTLWTKNVLIVWNCHQFRCAARYPRDRCHQCLKDHTTAICFFRKKSAKAEKTAINRQLSRPILRFWKSRRPGSISARLAYLAANLKIRKFGVVKITWTLSRIPKTSNFEKKIPKVTRRDGYRREWRQICLKAYTTATRFFRKMSGERIEKQIGPRRRSYREFRKRRKNGFLSDSEKKNKL